MAERGQVRNVTRATEARDFSGLRYGNRTPTDLDALLDLGGQCWVLIEAKHEGADLPDGQRIALERLVDQLNGVRPAILMVAETGPWTAGKYGHRFDVAKTRACRVDGFWHDGGGLPCKAVVDAFVRHVRPDELDDMPVVVSARVAAGNGSISLESGRVIVRTGDEAQRAALRAIDPAVLAWALHMQTSVNHAQDAGRRAFVTWLERERRRHAAA